MSGRSEFLPQDRRAWLLAIGQRLRAEYSAIAQPVPQRLAALLDELERPAQGTKVPPRDDDEQPREHLADQHLADDDLAVDLLPAKAAGPPVTAVPHA
jgi:hypothetical protein